MQRDPPVQLELEPTLTVRRTHELHGVEVWSMFNWLRPGCYCVPSLWFSAPFGPTIQELTMRHDGRPQTCDRTALLTAAAGEVCVIERLRGFQPRPGERTLVNLAVPLAAIEPELRMEVEKKLRCQIVSDAGTAHALRSVCRAIERGDQTNLKVDEMLQSFLLRVLRPLGAVTAEAHSCPRALRRAQDYIHSNWDQTFSLEMLAEAAGVSKWYLTRTFSRAFGVPPSEYARAVRARHALAALRAGRLPAHIASELGYSDQAHLTREIQRLYAITPATYRKGIA
jgi:AraC-like DNA-binding protein